MPFDSASFQQMLSELIGSVTLRIVSYDNELQPSGPGGTSQGVNLDVGEIHDFDLRAINGAALGLLDITVEITARHGKLCQSYSGLANGGSGVWTGPWSTSITVRPFNLQAGETYTHRHALSGGCLFGYRVDTPTGGADNARDIETLLTARVISWRPDLSAPLKVKDGQGPTCTYDSFIQRS